MSFIFDEMIVVKSVKGDVIWVSAASIEAITPDPDDVNGCYIHMHKNSYMYVGEPVAVVKHKVDEARNKQARKLDNIISTIRTAIRRV